MKLLPAADTRNREAAPAYAYGAEHSLAQLAATGTLQAGFYGTAEAQLADVLKAAACAPEFVAKAAVYARARGAMKDMPALLAAYLTVADPDLSVRVFGRVIDSGRMLRTFVQIMRSGAVGRSSLGSRPKRLVQQWLETATWPALMRAATGNDPSLAEIVRMVHPKLADAGRRAFYASRQASSARRRPRAWPDIWRVTRRSDLISPISCSCQWRSAVADGSRQSSRRSIHGRARRSLSDFLAVRSL